MRNKFLNFIIFSLHSRLRKHLVRLIAFTFIPFARIFVEWLFIFIWARHQLHGNVAFPYRLFWMQRMWLHSMTYLQHPYRRQPWMWQMMAHRPILHKYIFHWLLVSHSASLNEFHLFGQPIVRTRARAPNRTGSRCKEEEKEKKWNERKTKITMLISQQSASQTTNKPYFYVYQKQQKNEIPFGVRCTPYVVG